MRYVLTFAIFVIAVTADDKCAAQHSISTCGHTPTCAWCPSTKHADVGVCYNYTDGSRCCEAQNMSVACSRSEKCCGAESHLATCCGANKTCCGGQCCGDDEICEPFNGCVPATFECASINNAYVAKCKTNLEICCGRDTMNPTCLP